jgi:hypothetical protein
MRHTPKTWSFLELYSYDSSLLTRDVVYTGVAASTLFAEIVLQLISASL